MKRTVGGVVATIFAMQLLPGGAWAGTCANQADASALRVAALQQELMVAAFTCHDVRAYNGFVLSHQPELQQSDADLKAFFVRRAGGKSGEASYHTYKTELANSASLRSLRDDGFCARASDEFAASGDRDGLSSVVGGRRWVAADVYPVCEGVALQTAALDPPRAAYRTRSRHADREEADARDDSYYGRDNGYYSRDNGYSGRGEDYARDDRRRDNDRDGGGFYAPAPHHHIDEDADR